MTFKRRLLEGAIECLIELLDDVDGDPDLEPEPIEEQHDAEAVPVTVKPVPRASPGFVIAERALRQPKQRQ
jgi:hypothetical protein